MTTPHALVSGASIAGLSAAFWLNRIGWRVTVVEKADTFRDGGQNIDVRGVAHDVLDLMGLTDAIKAQNTTETGTVLVDDAGAVTAELPSEGPDGATAELEVLRGDFARTIRDHLGAGVEFLYGDPIATVGEDADEVTVTTRSGRILGADLLVIAEGVRSSTRDMLFTDGVQRHDLGVTMAFGTIARAVNDDDRWRWYNAVSGRQVHLRPDNHGTTRAILGYATAPDDDNNNNNNNNNSDLTALSNEQALSRLRERFADAGWEAARVLDGFDTSDDVYIDRLTQIDMTNWHRRRVCVTGDAAWCVTPLGGGGASLALTSGYVLAAYLSTAVADTDDTPADGTSAGRYIESALTAYETWMRPVVDDVQKFSPAMRHFAFPQTELGLKVSGAVTRAMTSRPLAALTTKLMNTAESDRALPEIAASR